MNLNIFWPRKAVEGAFEKPNVALAFLIVFVSALAGMVFPSFSA